MTTQNKMHPVIERFQITENTLHILKNMKPEFGFNGLGELVFRRTYSRNNEEWVDVVKRVIEGCMSIRKDHFVKNSLEWDDNKWQDFAKNMAVSLFKMEWLPPGRGLWMMGTDYTYNRGSMALYNCSAVDTTHDIVHAAEWTMDCLMNGVGVGFNTMWRGKVTIPDKDDNEIYVIPDSREGWVESLIKLMCAYIYSPKYGKNKFPIFDYSQIRPKGLPIKGFGGTSSGPEPLQNMHKHIEEYLDALCKGRLQCKSKTYKEVNPGDWQQVEVEVDKPYSHTRLIADVFNAIGACVVAGNVRRCKPEGTLVFTDAGIKKIEDVAIGDKVKTTSGYCNVTENIHQGQQELMCIHTQLGENWCTPNHRVAVLDTPDSYIWKRAKDLDENDYLLFTTGVTKGIKTSLPEFTKTVSNKHETINIPELDTNMSWFLGYFQGNGNVYENTVTISINSEHTKTVKKVVSQLEKFSVIIKQEQDHDCTVVVVYNKNLATYLLKIKQPWSELNVPDCILKADEFIRGSYLAGLYDADGISRPIHRLTVLLTSTASKFLYQLQTIYSSLGIPVRHKFIKKTKNEHQKDSYELHIVGKYSKDLWKSLVGIYSSRYIPHEYYKHIRNIEDYHFPRNWFEGVNITPTGTKVKANVLSIDEYKEMFEHYPEFIPIKVLDTSFPGRIAETFDLSVENEHEYFCDDGTLVHNSAEICLGSVGDDDFINLKNFEINPERGDIAWMSNNSIVLKASGDYSDFSCIPEMAKRICDNGEPGMINLYNIQKYGRYGKESHDDATLVNPCGEINLESFETCNLAEVFPPRCANADILYQALEYATFYASTVSLLPTHRAETNAIIARNRRIGISISGIAQWASGAVKGEWESMNYTKLSGYLRQAYKVVKNNNVKLAREAGVPASIRITTVKPSGSISLLAGATPGVHYPVSRYAIRRVRIGETSPLIQPLIDAGVPYEKDICSQNTLVFEFVIDHGDVRPCEEVSPWEQFSLVQMLQKHYADNCVSACLTKDHYVHTQDGFVRIDKLCNDSKSEGFHEHNISVFNMNGDIEHSEHYYVNGKKNTIKIELVGGKTIQGTDKHKLTVLNSNNEFIWKRMDEITEKDWVVSRKALNKWGNNQISEKILNKWVYNKESSSTLTIPTKMTPKLGFWLGCIVSNGCASLSTDYFVTLSRSNNNVDTEWADITKELFGLYPQFMEDDKNKSCSYSICINSKKLNRWVKYLGIYDENNNKQIPDIIMCSDKLTVTQFIRGLTLSGNLYDTHISVTTTKDKKLLEQLDILLNNFGITGSINIAGDECIKRFSNNENFYAIEEYYSYHLSKNPAYLFFHMIGFAEDKKTGCFLERFGNKHLNIIDTMTENIPDCLYKDNFRKLILPTIKSQFLKDYFNGLCVVGNKTEISRQALLQMKDMSANLYIPEHLLDYTYSFTKVKNIDNIEEPVETFDISVSETHSYLANGIISHNTIYFDREKDGPDVEKMLAMYIPLLKSVSMLPHSGHGYAQAPYEPISKEEYEKRLSEFKYPTYSKVVGNVPEGSKYCSGDTCEL